MDKEIKFAAWVKKVNRMFYFDTFQICSEYDSITWVVHNGSGEYELLAGHSSLPSNEEEDYKLMQYTGLKDTDGKEEYFDFLIRERDGTIRQIEDGCSAVLFKDIKTGDIKYFWQLQSHQIIGNIHENPEAER